MFVNPEPLISHMKFTSSCIADVNLDNLTHAFMNLVDGFRSRKHILEEKS